MQPQTNPQPSPQFSLRELEQIESVIQVSEQWINSLQERRAQLTAELDRITRPQPAVKKMIGPGLEYRGLTVTHWTCIDIHVDLLRKLWIDFPERREAIGRAVGQCGTSRAYVARSVLELFPGRSLAWAHRYSRQLVEGWHVDTNLNRERMRRILPVAVEASGLKWGKDVKAYWRATPA